MAHIVEQPSVLNKFFFQNYNSLPHSDVRAESLRVGCENMSISSLFGPPCSFRMTCSQVEITLKVEMEYRLF